MIKQYTISALLLFLFAGIHFAQSYPPSISNTDVQGIGIEAFKRLIQKGYNDWKAFKKEFGKVFKSRSEENERMLTFLTAQQTIQKHNDAFRRGEKSFEMGISWLTDLPFELYMKLNGYRQPLRFYLVDSSAPRNISRWLRPFHANVPDQLDWRENGYVTEVKNQGMCGSCWAFSATGSLEGQHKRATGELISLSEQNLVDCSSSYGNHGCEGGLMDNAFQYIRDNRGIDTESSYPYVAHKHSHCEFKRTTVGADDAGFTDLPQGDEDALKEAVATQGPVSVAIDAGHTSFQHYSGGVYHEPKCSSEQLNHGVLVVGYGTDSDYGDYWIVKNSWGPKWGENGFIKMARNRNNNCGIATQASYPLV